MRLPHFDDILDILWRSVFLLGLLLIFLIAASKACRWLKWERFQRSLAPMLTVVMGLWAVWTLSWFILSGVYVFFLFLGLSFFFSGLALSVAIHRPRLGWIRWKVEVSKETANG